MDKLKVMTIVGTRPEIIRLSRVIAKLDLFTNHTLVHTGQNYDYELNDIFFQDLEIRPPDYFLNAAAPNSSKTIGKILIEVDNILEEIKPEAILVLGDTNSCISIIAAKKKKIPTFHYEAGNRCFDMRVPEEINRKIVDHVADINLTYSSIAREYLLKEGLCEDMVIKVGSPMMEILNFYRSKINQSSILADLNLKKESYFVASIHREENIDSKNFKKIIEILNFVADKYTLPIIVSTHPRTKNKLKENHYKTNEKIRFLKPQSFSDYINLQINSKAVLSDSGTINEESSILNFPALNIREAHERPEAMEEASVILTGVNSQRVAQALEILSFQKRGADRTLNLVKDYDVLNVSDKILRIITSYTDYVNRKTWKKY